MIGVEAVIAIHYIASELVALLHKVKHRAYLRKKVTKALLIVGVKNENAPGLVVRA